jgi:hypothetical protein
MRISRVLFPRDYRSFPGKRWVNIALRTVHLIGVAGLGGGFLYQAPQAAWLPYLVLSIASGFAIMCLDIWTDGIWLIQLRGIAILIKLIVLLCVPFFGGYEPYVLVIVIVISGLIAHAPGDVRYFSIFHGGRIEDLCDKDSEDSREEIE